MHNENQIKNNRNISIGGAEKDREVKRARFVHTKKLILTLAVFFLALLSPVVKLEAFADSAESIWFPAYTMNLSQLAYENYSHQEQNAIDILPNGNVFAPFSGKIAYIDKNWGYVTLQSLDKVYWADGSYDYATVGFMHDSNISDLYVGMELSQGQDFYQAGGMGNGNPKEYGAHVHLTVHRGHVERGYPYGAGDEYAFNAFFINKELTTNFEGRGAGHSVSGMLKNAPGDYETLWKAYDAGYIGDCSFYSSHGTVQCKKKCVMKTLPCSVKTCADSLDIRTVKKGELLEVTGLYKNTAGNCWYRINTGNGVGFVYSGDMGTFNVNWSDIYISDVSAPRQLSVGDRFSIKGKVSADHSKIDSVWASIATLNGNNIYISNDSVRGNQYSLLNSKLDNEMLFNKLSRGTYVYNVWVECTAHSTQDTKTVQNHPICCTLVSETFTVN